MRAEVKSGLVSIIVASYNHAEYLEQRMDSLINQTYENIEIIVVDDCSPDNSIQVLRKYESHPKVKLIIREKNGGWVTVSNQGVEMSLGEFIIFANCDDTCEKTMIERLVASMRTNPTAGISYCRSLMIDEKGGLLGDDFAGREKAFRMKCANAVLLSKKEMSRFLLNSCVIPNLSAALFRKECYLSVGGLVSDFRVCSDWDIFFKIVTQYDVAYVADSLNGFRQHKTTIRSSTKERIVYEEYIRLLLSQMKKFNLTYKERARVRVRVMYLWSAHILQTPLIGVSNLFYHIKCIFRFDPFAFLFFPIGFCLCFINLLVRLPRKVFR